jgi:hypothetical protein
LVCRKHHKIVKEKFCFCKDCGRKITLKGSSGKLPERCAVCSPPRKKSKEVLMNLTETAFDIFIERSDCIYRPLCMEVHLRDQQLPCIKCPDYEPKDLLNDLSYEIDLAELDAEIKKINTTSSKDKKKFMEKEAHLKWGKIYDKRNRDTQRDNGLRKTG